MSERTVEEFQERLENEIVEFQLFSDVGINAFSEASIWLKESIASYDDKKEIDDVKRDTTRLMLTFKKEIQQKMEYCRFEENEKNEFKVLDDKLTSIIQSLITSITMKELDDGSVKDTELAKIMEAVEVATDDTLKFLRDLREKQRRDIIQNINYESIESRLKNSAKMKEENTKINEISDSKMIAATVKNNSEYLKMILKEVEQLKKLGNECKAASECESVEVRNNKPELSRLRTSFSNWNDVFRTAIFRISKIDEKCIDIEDVYIGDIPWFVRCNRISEKIVYQCVRNHLVVFLECQWGTSQQTWECLVHCKFRVLNQYNSNSDRCLEITDSELVRERKLCYTIPMEKLFALENGYIMEDAIVVELDLTYITLSGMRPYSVLNPMYTRETNTITHTFENVSKGDETRSSNEVKIGGCSWRISFGRRGTFIICYWKDDKTTRSCIAKLFIRVLNGSETSGVCHDHRAQEFQNKPMKKFYIAENITWERIMEKKNEFMKDDAITIQAIITVYKSKTE